MNGGPTSDFTGIVLVTGTGTGVGKTTVTAALAAEALAAGRRVAVVKPAQTGVRPGEPGDVEEVRRLLTGLPGVERLGTHEFVRLPDPLAPQAAARLRGLRLPSLSSAARRIADLAGTADLVLVEGAGGVLVRLDDDGHTLADLVRLCRPPGAVRGAVVVTGPELGTLNATELTVEALGSRGVPVLGLVIGCWPADPGLAERENVRDLPLVTGVPLLGVVPPLAGPAPGSAGPAVDLAVPVLRPVPTSSLTPGETGP